MTIGRLGHGNVGTRLAVDILEDIGDWPSKLGTRANVMRSEGVSLNPASRNGHGWSGCLGRRSRSARCRSGRTRNAIGASIGIALGSPDGGNARALAFRSSKFREKLVRLGIESGLLWLASCLDSGRRSRSRGILSRLRGQFVIRHIFNSHMVLLETLGNGLFASIGEAGSDRFFGSHYNTRIGGVTRGWRLDRNTGSTAVTS